MGLEDKEDPYLTGSMHSLGIVHCAYNFIQHIVGEKVRELGRTR